MRALWVPPCAPLSRPQRISDVPELLSLRQLFQSKYSKEYVQEASSDVTCSKWQVNTNLIRCLLVRACVCV